MGPSEPDVVHMATGRVTDLSKSNAHGAERPFGEKWMPLRMVADADSAQAGLPPLDSSRCRADSYSYTSTGSGDEEWSSSGLGARAAPLLNPQLLPLHARCREAVHSASS